MNQRTSLMILILSCSFGSFVLLLCSILKERPKLLLCMLLIFASLLIVIGLTADKSTKQELKKLEWSGEIPPRREWEVVLKDPKDANRDFIVPKGEKLCLHTLTISCKTGCLQEIRLPGITDIPINFFYNKQISIMGEITEGGKIVAYLHNLDVRNRKFALTIDATLSRMGWKWVYSYLCSFFSKIRKCLMGVS